MSLLGFWERRRTLLFVFLAGLVGTASAESGLNVAVIEDIITGIIAVMAGLVDLVIASIPVILVFSVLLFLIGMLALLKEKL